MKIVIVGGVAAGMSAAARLRRLDAGASITVVEKSGHVSFANCGLPYYVGGVIEDRSSLLLQTPESLGARFGLDVRVRTEAVRIDREARVVTVRNLDSGDESDLRYDALVLAPGATPVRPPIPGIERALTLRTVEDTDVMAATVAGARSAVVIGGGFIGLELAENLIHRGLRVTLVEAAPQVMAPLDPEMVAPLHDLIRGQGVDLRLSSTVAAIDADGVDLVGGERIQGDLVVAAIGVRPESGLARDAGLTLGSHGGIVVDGNYRTSDPFVYAAGDAVEKVDAIDGGEAAVPLANTANLQGRRIADTIAGRDVRDRPVLGTAIVGLFGWQAATVGWNEKRLVAAGRAHRIIHTHAADHAGYYPGAQTMSLKLLVDPTTDLILGAQAVGRSGVDKRIDVIATAMRAGLTASGLAELELAYSPQFGSAKDPVNMLGFIDENRDTGLEESVQWHEVEAARAAGEVILDVRTPGEYAAGAIPGAINIPVDELRERAVDLPEGDVIVHCAVGIRGHVAARVLEASGRRVRNLDGGYRTWSAGTSSQA